MEKKLLLNRFFGQLPNWECPSCDHGKLIGEKSITFSPNANTAKHGGEEWFDTEDAQYVFTCVLRCSHCQESVIVAGDSEVAQFYDDHNEVTYDNIFTPTYFTPPLKIINPKLSPLVPEDIGRLLKKASEVFWCDADSSLNRLRAIIEVVLDAQKVPRAGKKGRMPLHNRIEHFSIPGLESVKDALMALKHVGNDGSHGISGIKRADLIMVFSIVEFSLKKLYPPTQDDSEIEAAIASINTNGGLKKRVTNTGP